MTADRLGKADAPRYAIIGECTEQLAVSHVGILESPRTVENEQIVTVFHMTNPNTRLELPGEMHAHIVGWIEDLTEEEQSHIDDWLAELKTSSVKIAYCACPAAEIITDKVNGRPIGRKFSCAGFVHCCFEEALQLMLVVHEEALPEVSIQVLQQVWGEREANIARRRYLRGPGPWKMLLPSYLFHALTKMRTSMPHRPEHADPYFPAGMPKPSVSAQQLQR